MKRKAEIFLQKRGFSVSLPITRNSKIDWESFTDALLNLPNVEEVDGPVGNGAVGVIYDNDDRSDSVLIAEIQEVCDRFIR